MSYIPILVEENAGIYRHCEPVSVGIPLPKGLLSGGSMLRLQDWDGNDCPLQTASLAFWPDGSSKWVLLDFQASVEAYQTLELRLVVETETPRLNNPKSILIEQSLDVLKIDTQAACFFLNHKVFSPFERVVIRGQDVLSASGNEIVLTDDAGKTYDPVIENIVLETEGDLRTTIKIEGSFQSSGQQAFCDFFSRLSFYVNSALVKLEFTLLNPKAAIHPGGLWDLGDPGSVFFEDLSLSLRVRADWDAPGRSQWQSMPGRTVYPINFNQKAKQGDLFTIYQDSSGGEHWKSLNHVNRDGEVPQRFRGYQVVCNGNVLEEGLRATPIIRIGNGTNSIETTVQHFWQNCPKALEAEQDTLHIRLFPYQFDDAFELQGGEQKTHTIFFEMCPEDGEKMGLEGVHRPLSLRTTPECYADSKALSHFVPENKENKDKYQEFIHAAIEGEQSFFKRREIIDEYGWRNFGELYGDHEAVGHEGPNPLISHYNNQYDGIFGFLNQYLRSGDIEWFILGDELCRHVKDIDIYHTDEDRIEYNRGLFWHTEHYIDAETATHRCFSKKHLPYRNKAFYGGGPSLSHVYSSGLLLHHYMTGSVSSYEAVLELALFVENNIRSEKRLLRKMLRTARKFIAFIKEKTSEKSLVQLNKVYGLDGPGRASGNALAVLLDAYQLTKQNRYLKKAETLIRACVHPNDDIAKKDLLDIENRWMYVVFFQSLGKYLDIKTEHQQIDEMWDYSRKCLLHYVDWMVKNEYVYLSKPEKLEYPNGTWGAQELRKCNVFLYAEKYAKESEKRRFIEKARYFYDEGFLSLEEYDREKLTRPIVLVLLNGMMFNYFGAFRKDNFIQSKS